ncbi:hypothetical protein ACHAXR_006823 [Thalassiosira sp. AJA248-18]
MSISKARADEVNAQMASVAPELASPYAKYPLSASGGRMWVNPNGGKTSKGEPCFIPGDGKPTKHTMLRENYVYGAGTMGFGWYHLCSRDPYNILYHRLQSTAPVPCCACSKEARKGLCDHDDVSRICYNRSVASIPDDEQATKDAIAIARGTAKAVYNFTQNEQLVINAVQTGAFLAGG